MASPATVSRRAIISYVFDYVIIIVFIVGFLALDAVEPHHQEFSLRNYTLQYKFAVHERVPNLALVTIAVVSPAVIICLYTLIIDGIFSHKVNGQKRKHTMKERLWELNCGLLGLGLSISLQYVIVGSLKNAIGKPRPDLIDRCRPTPGSADPQPFGLSNSTICTQTNHAIMKDGFRSFPSGHSSTSFGGLFYLSLYLAAKLHVLDSRGEAWKMFIVLIPSLGAALVAGSRIMDARHHPFDVITGSLLGMIISWIAYRQYFPAISNFHAKGRAYPMRTWGKGRLGRNERDEYDYQQPMPNDEDAVQSSSTQFGDSIQLLQRKQRYNDSDGRPIQSYPAVDNSSKVPTTTIVPVLHSQSSDENSPWKEDGQTQGEYKTEHTYGLSDPTLDPYDPATPNTAYESPSMTKRMSDTQSSLNKSNIQDIKRSSTPGEVSRKQVPSTS